jgi:hypothetical protein
VPASSAAYWVGEALGKTDYKDAGPKPDTTGSMIETAARHAVHLAKFLKTQPYPPKNE